MAWPTVQASDIADRWRPLTEAEQAVAAKRIEDVEAELQDELRLRGVDGTPGIPPLASPDAVDAWESRYRVTIVDAVRRYLINPDGWLEEREAIDDYDRTRRRDKSVSGGLVYLSDDEIDKLVPRRRRKRGAFSIHLGQS
ncbi:hypothetical protein [Microbacterium rhizophilus]|uniref:hypothetical protein n=1 Tax=Microbacterium rhizophilus TaxID=3138934 RepID=UPI0031E7AF4E